MLSHKDPTPELQVSHYQLQPNKENISMILIKLKMKIMKQVTEKNYLSKYQE